MKNLKRLAYILLILSYFIVGFILIDICIFHHEYEKTLLFILIFTLIAIWFTSIYLFEKTEKYQDKKDKFTTILKIIALLPFYFLFIPIAIIPVVIDCISNSFKNKVKPLVKNGFTLRKEVCNKEVTYFLLKDNIVLKIKEFDLYQISEDTGNTFLDIANSKSLSSEQKEEFSRYLYSFYGCDYRDKDLYDPTRKLVSLLIQNHT